MKQGTQTTTGNITQTSTGFTKLAAGTTAQRPTTPADGMTRYNTTTKAQEFYSNGEWHNVLELSNGDSLEKLEIAQLTGSGGVQSDPLLFVRSSPTVCLSVATLAFRFTTSGAYNQSWLQVDSNIWDANIGYQSPFNAAVIGITGSTTSNRTSKSIAIYINDTPFYNALTFIEDGSLTSFSVTSIPVPVGGKIRARAFGSGNMGAVTLEIITKWRI